MPRRLFALFLLLTAALGSGTSAAAETAATADDLRGIEEARLRALVAGDAEAAGALHADDFQLITPFGMTVGKEDYLDWVGSGVVDYHVWEPGPIEVRLYPGAAVVRYQAEIEITFRGNRSPRGRFWHTDLYELRDGQWQVVWSQATEIREPD